MIRLILLIILFPLSAVAMEHENPIERIEKEQIERFSRPEIQPPRFEFDRSAHFEGGAGGSSGGHGM